MAELAHAKLGDKDVRTLDALGAAYAEAGKFDEATATAKRVIELARQSGNPKLVSYFQKRLQLYENRQPYRQPTKHQPGQ